MATRMFCLVPLLTAAAPILTEAAQADRDTTSTPGSTSITAPEEAHDPATDIASITADRGIVTGQVYH